MKEIQLSKKAIEDLRLSLRKAYGEDVDKELSDKQINRIGDLLLTSMAESMMLEIANPQLSAKA